MILKPASAFSLETLTDAYNRTRTDYLIPMPMNVGRLREYITLYDVDLATSVVAIEDDVIIGLGMLGVRKNASWITRLGVLPEGRRRGVGTAILQTLVDQAKAKDSSIIWLEVIKGNDPAYELFSKFNFKQTRELIVARRPPRAIRSMSAVLVARKIHYLQHDEVIDLHCARNGQINWLNAVSSMKNTRRLAAAVIEDPNEPGPLHEVPHLSGIWVEFQNGTEGWVSYQTTTLQIRHVCVEVIKGNNTQVTADLLGIMHRLHGSQDAVVENIADDEQWAGFVQSGYFEVFRRIEMYLGLEGKIIH